jgi:hypothetical protein
MYFFLWVVVVVQVIQGVLVLMTESGGIFILLLLLGIRVELEYVEYSLGVVGIVLLGDGTTR